MFNRKCIFKGSIFHCCFSLPQRRRWKMTQLNMFKWDFSPKNRGWKHGKFVKKIAESHTLPPPDPRPWKLKISSKQRTRIIKYPALADGEMENFWDFFLRKSTRETLINMFLLNQQWNKWKNINRFFPLDQAESSQWGQVTKKGRGVKKMHGEKHNTSQDNKLRNLLFPSTWTP